MLVHDFVQVAAPLAVVRDQLLAARGTWLTDGACGAYADAEELSLVLKPTEGPVRLGKRVQVDLGAPYPRGENLVVPMSWTATGPTWLFPTLEADLELAPAPGDTTRVTLLGRYEPPLGAFGRGIDRVVMNRVAQASVRSFLRHLAECVAAAAKAA